MASMSPEQEVALTQGLCELFQVVYDPKDPINSLDAVYSVLNRKTFPSDQEAAVMKETKVVQGNKEKYTLDSMPLGPGDTPLLASCQVLRLMHMNRLRSVQNAVNDAIVDSQSITASPKTDTSLATSNN